MQRERVADCAGTQLIGASIPPQEHRFTRTGIARFCAATWNSARIHLDPIAAQAEGLPDVVVPSTLYPETARLVLRGWLRDEGVESFSVQSANWQNMRPVVPGQTVIWTGAVDRPFAASASFRARIIGAVGEQRVVDVTIVFTPDEAAAGGR